MTRQAKQPHNYTTNQTRRSIRGCPCLALLYGMGIHRALPPKKLRVSIFSGFIKLPSHLSECEGPSSPWWSLSFGFHFERPEQGSPQVPHPKAKADSHVPGWLAVHFRRLSLRTSRTRGQRAQVPGELCNQCQCGCVCACAFSPAS